MRRARWQGDGNSDELRRLALDALFLDSPETMYVMDTEGRFLAGNPALIERTGVAWEQLRTMDFGPIVHPDDRERVRDAFRAAAAGTTQHYDTRGIRPDGSVFHSHAVNVPVVDGGEVIAVAAIAYEIDELTGIRNSLTRSEARLDQAFDGIADAIAFVDHDWRITMLNARAIDLLGRGSPDLVGTILWDLQLPDPEGERMLRDVMRAGKPLARRRYDEHLRRWMEITGFPAGDLLGIQVRDVTEMEEARRQLHDDSRRIHAQAILMDSGRDAIIMRGLGDIVEYANPASHKLLGTDDPVGRSLHDLLRLDDATAQQIELAIGRSGEWEGELVIRRADGTERITQCRWQSVNAPDGNPDAVFCVLIDVTDRRAQDELLARTQRMESIGTLASGIAHDLNNVLTPLLLSTQLLSVGETDERRLRILEGMRSTVERGGDMIRQVLTFARGVEGTRTVVDIAGLTRRFAEFCRDILPKDIVVEVTSADDLAVLGDPTQLLQVLMNLATNARDAMPDGGRLTLAATGDESRILVEVSDDGTGMTPESLARIFEPFYTTKGVGRGTGLGLSVSQAIARTHGGSLEATSTLGSGTTFRLDLPRTEWTAEECPDATRVDKLDGLRVLIVDDEDAIVDLATLVVSDSGGFAFGATDALHAQSLLDDSEVDVIVSDLVMPGTSGRAFLDWLGANRSNVPVVAMSGIPEQTALAARRANVRATLDKPFTAGKLIAAINTAASARDS